ncbi:MAG: gliding motility-associated C-terminal domain-containing protein [Sphingobacteriales bacterium]|nr:gliding motility-associated C-terminal domain-containing protein [Sphingobacteriales bacterium]
MPTAFSPNGDGQNDVFRAQASGTITDYYLVVYNRWGQMVFETTDLNAGWDGMFNGQQQEMGVYVYYARYTFAGDNEDLLRGNVTLLR